MKASLYFLEEIGWSLKCMYNLWLHGPYGLSRVIEKMPFRYLLKYLRKYGASVGDNCVIERGLNLHRPFGNQPFENLQIGNYVYLGHKVLIDLTEKVIIGDNVKIGAGCHVWTHSSYFRSDGSEKSYNEHTGSVEIGKDVIIFSGVVISPNTSIGDNSMVGANSLVNRNVAPSTFAGGVPVRELRKL